MSVGMSLLAILEERATYGLDLRNEFEARTGGIFPLNVGQVYTTLARLQRDGLVEVEAADASDSKVYTITELGRRELARWFDTPAAEAPPSREEVVLKLVMVARRDPAEASKVIQAERRGAVQLLQEYTRLKRSASSDGDLGWMFLLDSLIFVTEARVRWLDACEARLGAAKSDSRASGVRATRVAARASEEVSR
ncbi:MAG TPA: PadR family transcriptional regulator [Actinomycetota bacterium]|nr:PadR family transcriptional regulator [Actinomycetota bacterium]